MIIVMSSKATDTDVQRVVDALENRGYGHHISRGVERTLIGAIGTPDGEKRSASQQLMALLNVERVVPILRPYKLVSREYREETSIVYIGDAAFGRGQFGVIAGPCTVESEQQTLEAARAVKAAGATCLRGGAFKPRTSPYDFQGLGEEGLKILAAAGAETADRGPQYAELRPAPERRQERKAGSTQTGPVRDGRGMAKGGGVRGLGGEF